MELSSKIKGLKFMKRAEEKKASPPLPTMAPAATSSVPRTTLSSSGGRLRIPIQVSYESTLVKISSDDSAPGIAARQSHRDYASRAAATGKDDMEVVEDEVTAESHGQRKVFKTAAAMSRGSSKPHQNKDRRRH